MGGDSGTRWQVAGSEVVLVGEVSVFTGRQGGIRGGGVRGLCNRWQAATLVPRSIVAGRC